MYRVESLVSFLRKHDVIKIEQKQKGNVLRVVQRPMQRTAASQCGSSQLDLNLKNIPRVHVGQV